VTILLVRHAEPVAPGHPRYPENDRPLSRLGRCQAERLRDELAGEAVAAVYSSPYPRALQTVQPLARLHGLDVTIVDDLRERLLSAEPVADWREQLRRSWLDFSLEVSGGESSAGAQLRIRTVLDELAARHVGETAVVASHGNLIALGLHAIAPTLVGFPFWKQMPMPAVYRLDGKIPPLGPGFDAA
jgi:2,3-bisphosphoglycerate-dependent phosphoglycerate mutase